jgi:hypothetical protein
MVTELLARSQAPQNRYHSVWSDTPHWRRLYAYRLVITDTLVLGWAVFGAVLVAVWTVRAVVARVGAA